MKYSEDYFKQTSYLYKDTNSYVVNKLFHCLLYKA